VAQPALWHPQVQQHKTPSGCDSPCCLGDYFVEERFQRQGEGREHGIDIRRKIKICGPRLKQLDIVPTSGRDPAMRPIEHFRRWIDADQSPAGPICCCRREKLSPVPQPISTTVPPRRSCRASTARRL
jgi:hypothetical protein